MPDRAGGDASWRFITLVERADLFRRWRCLTRSTAALKTANVPASAVGVAVVPLSGSGLTLTATKISR